MARGYLFVLVEMKAAIFKIRELFKTLFKTFIDIFKYFLVLFNCSVMSDLCDLMDCSTQGFPDLHHLLELAQTHPLSW